LVFPELLNCFTPHTRPPTGVYLGGIDFGFRNPFCALNGVIYKAATGKDVVYIYAERYQANTPIENHAQALRPPHGPGPEGCIWFCDPEDPEAIRELKKHDMDCKRAVNNITYGIDAVNGLAENGQLFISDRCIHTREEAEVYCYSDKNLKEKPLDQFNHAMSALRYLIASARRRGLIEWTRKESS
jgi:phage terminase large subunit